MEDRRGGSGGEDGHWDRFPVGMRVLAVDDDRTCLKILESLLHQCHYHVTSTTQAISALEMLRENRNKFDLVISDVSMPDMDGFKLLELVGLEMDLPVIMLSTHSDTELVMKGISHGAVDYLVKPVRIQELKNIWQHVVRKKKFEYRGQSKALNQDKARGKTGEFGQGATSTTACVDQSAKVNKRRKDQIEDEDEEGDDGNENEDPSSQKKARVVWSVDLHKKFVAAVNQIGLERAVPKKILDLMDVEGLSRENVASHLQKYRLYLRRIETDQAKMDVAFGGKDQSYYQMHSLEGFGDFRAMNGPSASFQSGAMLCRLNPGLVQQGNPQHLNDSRYSLGKNHCANMLREIPTSSELNQLSRANSLTQIGDFTRVNDPTFFSAASSLNNMASSTLQANALHTQSRGALGNQPSLAGSSFNQGSFMDVRGHEANFAYLGSNARGLPLPLPVTTRLDESRVEMQCQPRHHYTLNRSSNGLNALVSSSGAAIDQNGAFGSRRADDLLFDTYHRDAPHVAARHSDAPHLKLRFSDDFLSEQQMKSQNGGTQNNYESLDDIMRTMLKQGQNNHTTLMDGEYWP